jgi:hypothetical protein
VVGSAEFELASGGAIPPLGRKTIRSTSVASPLYRSNETPSARSSFVPPFFQRCTLDGMTTSERVGSVKPDRNPVSWTKFAAAVCSAAGRGFAGLSERSWNVWRRISFSGVRLTMTTTFATRLTAWRRADARACRIAEYPPRSWARRMIFPASGAASRVRRPRIATTIRISSSEKPRSFRRDLPAVTCLPSSDGSPLRPLPATSFDTVVPEIARNTVCGLHES